jgi:CRISPR/Cas system-associated exonuclease Cas4 (RecB family)
MNKSSPKISQVSQSTLNLWQICPRKFEHQVLDNLHLPSEFNAKMEQGSRFHLLMQQKELGLDITNLAASDRQLQNWIGAFDRNPPVMIEGDRYSEHLRTHRLHTYILTAIYDLLILGTNQAQILDWKTHNHPISALILQSNWQTRLYLYILAATTDYLPEQLSMSYWFANTGTTVAIAYNSQDRHETHQELTQILSEMSESEASNYFRQLPQGSEKCNKCEFKYRCERSQTLLNLGAISAFPEVQI